MGKKKKKTMAVFTLCNALGGNVYENGAHAWIHLIGPSTLGFTPH